VLARPHSENKRRRRALLARVAGSSRARPLTLNSARPKFGTPRKT
jgi:hypothetical protein